MSLKLVSELFLKQNDETSAWSNPRDYDPGPIGGHGV